MQILAIVSSEQFLFHYFSAVLAAFNAKYFRLKCFHQHEFVNLSKHSIFIHDNQKIATFTTLLSSMEQVFLSSTVIEYSSLTIELNKPIKNDLVLDKTQEYLYVMTTDKVMYPSLFKHQVQFNFLCDFT